MYPVKIIAAITEKEQVLGHRGQMPWGHIPRDLAHFKKHTMGHVVVMGYQTFMSIKKPLHGRITIVLTNHPEKLNRFNGSIGTTNSIEEILKIAKTKQVLIVGGAKVYEQFIDLPETKTLYLTRIYAKFPGDTFFPHFSGGKWRMIKTEHHGINAENKYQLSFETWIQN